MVGGFLGHCGVIEEPSGLMLTALDALGMVGRPLVRVPVALGEMQDCRRLA
jgi:hypothetical protein